jgi:hypothetical protein
MHPASPPKCLVGFLLADSWYLTVIRIELANISNREAELEVVDHGKIHSLQTDFF